MSLAEPRWDRDLEYGKQGELRFGKLLQWIAGGNGRVENKRKRRLDLWLYVEAECDKGRSGLFTPSGISRTQADVWTFECGETGITFVIPTPLLRKAFDHPTSRPARETDGSCPTRGRLVNVAAILAVAKEP